ncbi:MAG: hypothetical protein KAX49_13070 [Halanaerobiales bacterium]|nr:hypothetical protein [Halanaerobiales bacterium]
MDENEKKDLEKIHKAFEDMKDNPDKIDAIKDKALQISMEGLYLQISSLITLLLDKKLINEKELLLYISSQNNKLKERQKFTDNLRRGA